MFSTSSEHCAQPEVFVFVQIPLYLVSLTVRDIAMETRFARVVGTHNPP